MYFQLRKIILWSRDKEFEPREVDFEPGMVNVVMGGSRTGKSAVIPIIDYCLASRSCAIPKKAIREACEWFGIVVVTDEGEKLLARRDPGQQDAVEEMYVIEGVTVQVPRHIIKGNSTASETKRRLDELAALSHLDFAGGVVENSVDYRPSFRDLMAFVFQPQNVVANRDVLFYRTDQLIHKTKLAKNILPYVLEAVSTEVLAAQHELERSRRILRRKERDLQQAQVVSSRWEAEMEGQLSKASELGLLDHNDSEELTQEAMLQLLRNVAKKTVDEFKADSSTITGAVEELVALEAKETLLAEQLSTLKARQIDLNRLRDGAGGYQDALAIQQDRLAISQWLSELPNQPAECPVCGHGLDSERGQIEEFLQALTIVENTANQITQIPAAVDREVLHIRQEIDIVAEKLAVIRRQKRALSDDSAEARHRQFHSLGVAHFLGQLGQALSLYDETHDRGELQREITELKKQIDERSRLVDEREIERRKYEAGEAIGNYITQFMPQLDNDHPNDQARLVIDDLTLKITAAEGVSYLWSIGSGSNWLSYHLATLLALQCFFLDRSYSSVPGFLIFDQPSQVYFPESISRGKTLRSTPVWDNDEDCRAVRQAFELLGKVVGERAEKLQIIVLDHAPIEVWGQIPFVHPAADWRSGEKLVPPNWPGAKDE